MIPANELRIGNLVVWNAKLMHPNVTLPPLHVEVTAILHDRIGYISPGIEYRVEPFEDDLQQLQIPYKSLDEFEPIMLTAEIMQCAAFTFTGSSKNAGWLSKSVADKEMKLYFNNDAYSYQPADKQNVLVKNVHQLQNLYFALTGSELDLQLSS